MSETDIFRRMGNVYCLLVDEKARGEREGALLLAVAERARHAGGGRVRAKRATRVLDLACGTGIHARLLGRAGYAVTAVDSSATMLAEARRFANPAAVRFVHGDLLEPLAGARRTGAGRARMGRSAEGASRAGAVRPAVAVRPAALALLLGNTLSVFRTDEELRRVLRHVADALEAGGLVLVQTLNYARLRRAGGSAIVRHGFLRGRETVVTKSLAFLDDGRHVVLTLATAQRETAGGTHGERSGAASRTLREADAQRRTSGAVHTRRNGAASRTLREKASPERGDREDWVAACESALLRALEPEEIVAAARVAGLGLREAWSGPGREAFDEEKSTDFVGLFEKAS